MNHLIGKILKGLVLELFNANLTVQKCQKTIFVRQSYGLKCDLVLCDL